MPGWEQAPWNRPRINQPWPQSRLSDAQDLPTAHSCLSGDTGRFRSGDEPRLWGHFQHCTLSRGLPSLTVNDSWKKFCFPSTHAYLWTTQLRDTLLQGKGMSFRGQKLVATTYVRFMSLKVCLSLFCLAGLFCRWTEIMDMELSSCGRLDPWFGVRRTNSVAPFHWQWTLGQMILALWAKVSFCIKWI